jgi:hypothetical protein
MRKVYFAVRECRQAPSWRMKRTKNKTGGKENPQPPIGGMFYLTFLLVFLALVCLAGCGRQEEKKESEFEKIDPYAGWQEFEQDWGLGWGKVGIKYPIGWRRIEQTSRRRIGRRWQTETVFLGFSPESGGDYYLKEPMVRFLVEENPSLVKACEFEDELTRQGTIKSQKEEEFSGRIICEKELEQGGVLKVATFMPYGKKMVVFVFEKVRKGTDNSRFLDDYLKIVRGFVLE